MIKPFQWLVNLTGYQPVQFGRFLSHWMWLFTALLVLTVHDWNIAKGCVFLVLVSICFMLMVESADAVVFHAKSWIDSPLRWALFIISVADALMLYIEPSAFMVNKLCISIAVWAYHCFSECSPPPPPKPRFKTIKSLNGA